MSRVVVIAQFAEGIPAALGRAIRTNRCSAVGALGYRGLATGHPNVVISEFNLAEWAYGKPHGLFGIAVLGIAFEPRGTPKGTVAGEIWKR